MSSVSSYINKTDVVDPKLVKLKGCKQNAAEFGGGRPDGSRRFTGNYGKNAKARNEVDLETGENSRREGRMFSWMKGESY